jgi:hypothetical protein
MSYLAVPGLRPEVLPAPKQDTAAQIARALEEYWHKHMYGDLPESYAIAAHLVWGVGIRGPVTQQERDDAAAAEHCRSHHSWVRNR